MALTPQELSNLNDPKDIATALLQNAIDKNLNDRIVRLLKDGEKYQVDKSLLKTGWVLAAQNELNTLYSIDSIIYYNKARRIAPSESEIFNGFADALIKFFRDSKDEFSKSDLLRLQEIIHRIGNFHKVNFPEQREIVGKLEDLSGKIAYKIEYTAREAVETKMTFRVNQLYDSLYGDMTLDEIQTEFARIIESDIRDIIDKDDAAEAEKKKKKPDPKEDKDNK